jgi:choline monooxygenase
VRDMVDSILAALGECAELPTERARSMPGSFYTSEAFLELEKAQIFRKEWICIGASGEIPGDGDYFTTQVAEEPLLIVRGGDGVVRALSNVCRHRGSPIAEGAGNHKRFTCPYHAWTYASDGRLLAAPYMEGNARFDKERLCLPSFRVEIWQGFIFVNLDGGAAPLAERLGPLEPLIRNYHHEQRHQLFTTDEVWATNWKCLTENFMEGYHIASTHPRTLNPMTPTALCEKVPGSAAFTAYKSH